MSASHEGHIWRESAPRPRPRVRRLRGRWFARGPGREGRKRVGGLCHLHAPRPASAAINVGLDVFSPLLGAEVAGEKGRHDPGPRAVRHGTERSKVPLGGRMVDSDKPRVRAIDGSGEIALETWSAVASRELLDRHTLISMLAGVSTRNYSGVLEPAGPVVDEASAATSKSAVSRRLSRRRGPVSPSSARAPKATACGRVISIGASTASKMESGGGTVERSMRSPNGHLGAPGQRPGLHVGEVDPLPPRRNRSRGHKASAVPPEACPWVWLPGPDRSGTCSARPTRHRRG